MAHPFFDTVEFPFSRPEGKALLNTLVGGIQVPNQINLTYVACAQGLTPLNLNQAHHLIWGEALQNLTAAGALRALLDQVKQQFQGPVWAKVIGDVENAQEAKDVKIISDDVLVLDRTGLREQLALLEPETNPIKVLIVRGAPQSGKSHGRYLFERAAVNQGAQNVYICDGMVATVDELVILLFSALEASKEIPDRLTSDEAWYRVVCFKLQEVAQTKKKALWIAVDDLGLMPDGASLLDKEIRKFCEQFGLNMVNPAFRKWFRLMLIHYPEGTVPTKWKREFWTEDRPADSDVKKSDVEEVLRIWSVTNNRKIVEDEITKLAGDVLAQAEAPPPAGQQPASRLERIHFELKKIISDLAKKP